MGRERGHNGAARPDGKRSLRHSRPPSSRPRWDCRSRKAPRSKPRPSPRRAARRETCPPLRPALGSAAGRGTPVPSVLRGSAAPRDRLAPAGVRRPPPLRGRFRPLRRGRRSAPFRRPRPGPGLSAQPASRRGGAAPGRGCRGWGAAPARQALPGQLWRHAMRSLGGASPWRRV